MEAGKAIGSEKAGAPVWARAAALAVNPLRAVWWLFTNVRFATALLAVLSLVSLLGVLVPQMPLNVRGDSVAESQWLASKDGILGLLADPMDAIGLFDVFHTGWFAMLMGTTVASTGAYIASRFPGIWAAITHPRRRVPDRYFEMAPNRFVAAEVLDIDRLELDLRRQRYRVERYQESGATYLFADRLASAQLGTLLTHAAVIIFIFSAIVSRVDALESGLFLAEGSTLPVFPVRNPEQIQVQLTDALAEFAPDGQALEYRSEMIISRNGEEVKRCFSTVNSPCSYEGFRFYQAAYFGFGAAVQVRDLATGNVVYQESLALVDRAPSPEVLIQDADGTILLEEKVVLTDDLDTGDVVYRGKLVTLPDGRLLTLGLQESGGKRRLAVFEPAPPAGAVGVVLEPGEESVSAGLKITYVKESMTPAARVPDLPLPSGTGAELGEPYLQMSNVVYGTNNVSEGASQDRPVTLEPPRLTISGLKPQAVGLGPGDSVKIGGYEYTFSGQREFAGINVKRDRSNYFVWVGAGLIVVGLMITFWVPRRRLWARIWSGGSALAGQAPGHVDYTRELRHLARDAGATENVDDDD